MEAEEKGSPLPAILLVVAVLSVGTACFVGAGVWEPAKTAVATTRTVAPAPAFQLGDIVKKKKESNTLVIAVTPEIAVTAERFCLADDGEGFRQLLDEKLIYGGDSTERFRIIGFDSDPEASRRLGSDKTWVQVRYLNGVYEGVAGWADANCLTR